MENLETGAPPQDSGTAEKSHDGETPTMSPAETQAEGETPSGLSESAEQSPPEQEAPSGGDPLEAALRYLDQMEKEEAEPPTEESEEEPADDRFSGLLKRLEQGPVSENDKALIRRIANTHSKVRKWREEADALMADVPEAERAAHRRLREIYGDQAYVAFRRSQAPAAPTKEPGGGKDEREELAEIVRQQVREHLRPLLEEKEREEAAKRLERDINLILKNIPGLTPELKESLAELAHDTFSEDIQTFEGLRRHVVATVKKYLPRLMGKKTTQPSESFARPKSGEPSRSLEPPRDIDSKVAKLVKDFVNRQRS